MKRRKRSAHSMIKHNQTARWARRELQKHLGDEYTVLRIFYEWNFRRKSRSKQYIRFYKYCAANATHLPWGSLIY